MMPTFPRSPLSFRTAGFPQYGWKAGFPGSAFPDHQRLKPAPRIRRPMFGLHPPFVHLGVATVVPHCVGPRTRLRTALEGYYSSAQGSSLRSGLWCPGPSSLSRPHPSHSWVHRDFTAWRLIRDAFAVRERLGDPRVVPGFRCSFRPNMPPSLTPGSSIVVQSRTSTSTLAFAMDQRALGTPDDPAIRFARGTDFGATLVRDCYGLSGCWPPCTDLTGLPANGGFYFQAFNGSVILPAAGYDYNSDWTPLLAGLSFAGMAASLAAPVRPCSCPLLSSARNKAPPRWGPRRGCGGQLATGLGRAERRPPICHARMRRGVCPLTGSCKIANLG